jgi:putative nucleotidyltransferase with HDIG domain
VEKILRVNHLKPGMFVSRLDRPWLGTPFLIQGLLIRTPEDVEDFRRWCTYVYIDTARGDDAPEGMDPDKWELILESALLRVAAQASFAEDYRADFSEEIGVARELLATADGVLRSILRDAHLGKGLDVRPARKIVAEMAESVVRNPNAMLFLTALKDRDDYTNLHSIGVCALAVAFGREIGLPMASVKLLGIGALLHDVGKMRTPLEILTKPDKLTASECQVMRSHVKDGVEILEHASGFPPEAVEVAREHHERVNGSGYPRSLVGDRIGRYGRLAALVDVYDAMTTDRVYPPRGHRLRGPEVPVRAARGRLRPGPGAELHPLHGGVSGGQHGEAQLG